MCRASESCGEHPLCLSYSSHSMSITEKSFFVTRSTNTASDRAYPNQEYLKCSSFISRETLWAANMRGARAALVLNYRRESDANEFSPTSAEDTHTWSPSPLPTWAGSVQKRSANSANWGRRPLIIIPPSLSRLSAQTGCPYLPRLCINRTSRYLSPDGFLQRVPPPRRRYR